MAIPIPADYNFRYNYVFRDNHYSMPCADVYGDCYGLGFMVQAERMIITPGKTIIVHPGSIQFMHKHLYHRTTYVSDNMLKAYQMKFRESVAEHIKAIIGKQSFDNLFSQISVQLTPKAQEKIIQLFQFIGEEWNHYDEYSDSAIEGYVIQIFIEAIRGQSTATYGDLNHTKHLPITDALHYMEQTYAADPSLEQTAGAIHISPAHLSRLFTSELGTSYSRFLTEIKLNHAMQLLINTRLPITEVAAQTGFKNSSYFSDVFKKYIGISPLKYRKGTVNTSDCTFLPFKPILQM